MNCKKTILISLFTIGILFLTNVSIANAACTRNTPTLSPSSSLSPQTTSPGQSATYSVTITNADIGCTSSSSYIINVFIYPPDSSTPFICGLNSSSGWSCTVNNSVVNNAVTIASGDSSTQNITVNSPSNAEAGNYKIRIRVTNTEKPFLPAEVEATYTITSPTLTPTPTPTPSILDVQIQGLVNGTWTQGETKTVTWNSTGVSQIKRYICTESICDKKEKCYYWSRSDEVLANNPPMSFAIGKNIDQNVQNLNPVNHSCSLTTDDLYSSSWYVKIVDAGNSSVSADSTTSFKIVPPTPSISYVQIKGLTDSDGDGIKEWGPNKDNARKITWTSSGVDYVVIYYCTSSGCYRLYASDTTDSRINYVNDTERSQYPGLLGKFKTSNGENSVTAYLNTWTPLGTTGTIKIVSYTDSSIYNNSEQIEIDPCKLDSANPNFTLTSSLISQTGKPGDTLKYELTIKNTDTNNGSINCIGASFDFELSTTSSSLSLPTINQIGGVRPNSSQTVNFSITAPSNPGEYPFTVKVIKNKDRTYHKAEKSLDLKAIVSAPIIKDINIEDSPEKVIPRGNQQTISFTSKGIKYVNIKFVNDSNSNNCFFYTYTDTDTENKKIEEYQIISNDSDLTNEKKITISAYIPSSCSLANGSTGRVKVEGWVNITDGIISGLSSDEFTLESEDYQKKNLSATSALTPTSSTPSISNVQIQGLTDLDGDGIKEWGPGKDNERKISWTSNGVDYVAIYYCVIPTGCYRLYASDTNDSRINYVNDTERSQYPGLLGKFKTSNGENSVTAYLNTWTPLGSKGTIKIVSSTNPSIYNNSEQIEIDPCKENENNPFEVSSLNKTKTGSLGGILTYDLIIKNNDTDNGLIKCISSIFDFEFKSSCNLSFSAERATVKPNSSKTISFSVRIPGIISSNECPFTVEVIKNKDKRVNNKTYHNAKSTIDGFKINLLSPSSSISDKKNCDHPADKNNDCVISSIELSDYQMDCYYSYNKEKCKENAKINISDLLKVIQFYNMGGYHKEGDNYVPGLSPSSRLDSVKNQLAAISEALKNLSQKITEIFGR